MPPTLVPRKGALFVWFTTETTETDIRAILDTLPGYCDCTKPDIGPYVIAVPFGEEAKALALLAVSPLVRSARQALEPGR